MMLTRCPGCATTFRVTPEQVKARHGKVRCGRCQHVFDAIEFLVDTAVAAPAMVPASEPESPAKPAEEVAPVIAPPAATTPVAPVEVPVPARASVVDTPATAPEEALDADTQPAEPEPVDDDDILLQPSPLSTTYTQKQSARQPGWPWTIAATLVLLVLLAQLMLAFRVDLAVKYPQVRPLLDMLCDYAHCTVELPSDPDKVSIEASDLHPGKKGMLELSATLHNRAPHAQAWPHLELTLTDGADKPIVRKVITPAQYLPTTQSESDGFAANGDLGLQLQLDASSLPAAGYRLYLFYP